MISCLIQTAARTRVPRAAAVAAGLILYISNNCVYGEVVPPNGWQGNFTVETLFDWEVPVSVVYSGAYESAWGDVPVEVQGSMELDLLDYAPTNSLSAGSSYISTNILPSYEDGDMSVVWSNQLAASSNLVANGPGIPSLDAGVTLQGLNGTISTILDDEMRPMSPASPTSISWGSFLKEELTVDDLNQFGLGDAFASISVPWLQWLSEWYSAGAEAFCNFVNRPALHRVLRGLYCLCSVMVFWWMAYTHLVTAMFVPLEAVLGSFAGKSK